MTEQAIKIKVGAEGAAEAAKQFEAVAASLGRTRAQQAEVSKAQQASTQTSRANQAAFEGLARATQQSAAANNAAVISFRAGTGAISQMGDATNQFRAKSAAAASLVGNLGMSFATLVPEMGAARTIIQSTGMAFGQFLGVLGGGPGIILGGVVAAIGLVSGVMASNKQKAEDLAEATKKNTAALDGYLDKVKELRATVTARLGDSKAKQDYEKRFAAGELSSDEYAVERIVAKEMYDKRKEVADKIKEQYLSGTDREGVIKLRGLQDQIGQAPQRGEQARVFEQQAREREALQKLNERSLQSVGLEESLLDVKKSNVAKNRTEVDSYALEEANLDRIKKLNDQEIESQQRVSDAVVALNQNELDQRFAADKTAFENWKSLKDQELAEHARVVAQKEAVEQQAAQAMKARNQAMTQAAFQVGSAVAGSTVKAFSEMAKGHKVQIAAVLEGIGDQMVAEGTRLLFMAAANAFIPGMQLTSGPLAAIGGAEIAAGLALGAVGARGKGGSNSGGGGSASASGSGGGTNYAAPFRDTASGDLSRGPTIINITIPTVTSPTAEDGLRIQEAMRKAQAVYG